MKKAGDGGRDCLGRKAEPASERIQMLSNACWMLCQPRKERNEASEGPWGMFFFSSSSLFSFFCNQPSRV